MDRFRVLGGRPLHGRVTVGGAKNATLPAMAAALLGQEPVTLSGLPDVRDVRTLVRLLEGIGAETEPLPGGGLRLTVAKVRAPEAPYELVKTMRAAVLVLGPLVAREGRARVSLPGGCAIGARPINLHLAALERLGVELAIEHGYVEARAARLRGAEIEFPTVSVTGTENVLMAACLAEGESVIRNAAVEPEVTDLARLLQAMGARIEGIGSTTLTVRGVARLGRAEHRVIPDRIEAGTFIAAVAMAGGEVRIENVVPEHLAAVIERLGRTGVTVAEEPAALVVRREGGLEPVDLRTEVYPGFPTDMQAQYLAVMTAARGISVVTETIFENRFMHVAELRRLGARIRLEESSAIVDGPARLSGATVMCTDLRASASLLIAALAAEGETWIERVYHIDRGYERIEEKLRGLGAAVERVGG